MQNKRLVGLYIIGLVEIFVGLFSLNFVYSYVFSELAGLPSSITPIYVSFFGGLSLLFLLGFGLWVRSGFARFLNILVLAAILVLCVLSMLFDFYINFVLMAMPCIIFSLLVIGYLMRPSLKKEFK